jgi:hypothetical protein
LGKDYKEKLFEKIKPENCSVGFGGMVEEGTRMPWSDYEDYCFGSKKFFAAEELVIGDPMVLGERCSLVPAEIEALIEKGELTRTLRRGMPEKVEEPRDEEDKMVEKDATSKKSIQKLEDVKPQSAKVVAMPLPTKEVPKPAQAETTPTKAVPKKAEAETTPTKAVPKPAPNPLPAQSPKAQAKPAPTAEPKRAPHTQIQAHLSPIPVAGSTIVVTSKLIKEAAELTKKSQAEVTALSKQYKKLETQRGILKTEHNDAQKKSDDESKKFIEVEAKFKETTQKYQFKKDNPNSEEKINLNWMQLAAVKMSFNSQQNACKKAQGNLEKLQEKIEVNGRELKKSRDGCQAAGLKMEKAVQEEKKLAGIIAVSKYLFFYK